jgi:DNA end-binding protein Ku
VAEQDEEEYVSPSGLRSFWTGTITFGLVSVPVALFPATRARGVSLRMVSDEGSPVRRRYVCSKDEEPLEADDIIRGYEIEKGKFVPVTDDELEAIAPRQSREIDLQLFVEREEIDPMYFERGYFLTPSGGSNKAYRLLAAVMEKSGRAGIATFVMRAKQYLVAILAENGILRAETLRFRDEVRTPEQIGLPKKSKPKPSEVKKFEQAIARKAGKVKLSEFLDDYAERLEGLVSKKQKKGEDIVKLAAPAEAEEESGEVVDLLAALRRSLGPQGGSRAKAKPAPRKTTAKKATAKKSTTKKSAVKKK